MATKLSFTQGLIRKACGPSSQTFLAQIEDVMAHETLTSGFSNATAAEFGDAAREALRIVLLLRSRHSIYAEIQ